MAVISDSTDRGLSAAYATAPAPLAKRISWGAVLAGAVLALVIQLSLSLLGLSAAAAAFGGRRATPHAVVVE